MRKAEIEERLQQVSNELLNAAFARDERSYYELYEQRGELRQALKELNSMPDQAGHSE